MPNGKPGDTLPEDKNTETQFVRSVTPFIAVGLALLAFLTNGGLFAALLVIVAFGVGWSVASGRLPFGRTLEERRDMGREVLRKLDPAQIDALLDVIKGNRKIEAIKMVRAETGDGLAPAKEAIDLLDDLGLNWNSNTETKR